MGCHLRICLMGAPFKVSNSTPHVTDDDADAAVERAGLLGTETRKKANAAVLFGWAFKRCGRRRGPKAHPREHHCCRFEGAMGMAGAV
mmetsp:Transcript_120187/g.383729  ORF Transcript_120187/g.383729 Transcript_120187/m.383729 type:complete len:88 (+) Transcript_120187:82-345(+)